MTWHILSLLLYVVFLLGTMFGITIAAWMHASKTFDRNFPAPPTDTDP